MSKFKILAVAFTAMALTLSLALPGLAMDKKEAEIKVDSAAIVVKQFMLSPDKGAPKYLLERAHAVVIIPGMVKGGFIFGGKYGRGVVLARKADGTWSPPSFILIGGATVGFQIGAQSADLFMLVMNKHGLDGILKNQLKFGADAAVTAGPVGRDAEASLSAANLKADIYSYSRSKGIFAGVTLEGAGLETDTDANKAYYGKAYTADQILMEGMVPVLPSAKSLITALEDFAK